MTSQERFCIFLQCHLASSLATKIIQVALGCLCDVCGPVVIAVVSYRVLSFDCIREQEF